MLWPEIRKWGALRQPGMGIRRLGMVNTGSHRLRVVAAPGKQRD